MTKFLSRLRLPLLIVAIMIAGFFVFSEPAEAGNCTATFCGTIRHGSDSGYDDPIAIRCDYGEGPTRFVYEGQSSKLRCHDTDEVYVRSNEEIHCRFYNHTTGLSYWMKTFDAQGWHKINDLFNHTCVVQRD